MFKFNLPLHSQLSPRSSAQEPNALQRDLTSPLFKLQSASLSDVQNEHLSEVLIWGLVVDWNAPPTQNSCNGLTSRRLLPPRQLQLLGPDLNFAYPNPLQVEPRVRPNQIHFLRMKVSAQEPSRRDFQR